MKYETVLTGFILLCSINYVRSILKITPAIFFCFVFHLEHFMLAYSVVLLKTSRDYMKYEFTIVT